MDNYRYDPQDIQHLNELIEEQLDEKGHDPELVSHLEQIELGVRHYEKELAISQMQKNVLQDHVRNWPNGFGLFVNIFLNAEINLLLDKKEFTFVP